MYRSSRRRRKKAAAATGEIYNERIKIIQLDLLQLSAEEAICSALSLVISHRSISFGCRTKKETCRRKMAEAFKVPSTTAAATNGIYVKRDRYFPPLCCFWLDDCASNFCIPAASSRTLRWHCGSDYSFLPVVAGCTGRGAIRVRRRRRRRRMMDNLLAASVSHKL